MSNSERVKGARGEREVLAMIKPRWPRATRNFASGAAGNSDIVYGPAGVCLEVKRTERLRLRNAWNQVSEEAHGRMPVVATRWNEGPWLAVVELDELLSLLHARETR